MPKASSSAMRPLPPWLGELTLVLILIAQEIVAGFIDWLKNLERAARANISGSKNAAGSAIKRAPRAVEQDLEGAAPEGTVGVLDLPDLALERILGALSPEELVRTACVCRYLREMCRSERLWERHMREKWDPVLGAAARRQWAAYTASRLRFGGDPAACSSTNVWMRSLPRVWPRSWLTKSSSVADCSRPDEDFRGSILDWYLALERGRFWFPSQVYNRENGNLGFVLSCYDAELSYDRHSDTFFARYPPHGCRAVKVEQGVTWERIRVPPVDASPRDLHDSGCLSELRPGDHIEIQWRRSKDFPYGWWYGVVGHLQSCDGNEHRCLCHSSDTIVIEFKQYAPGSRWRQAAVSRMNRGEEGNETGGFFGGIRKVNCKDEISTWRRHWPAESLE